MNTVGKAGPDTSTGLERPPDWVARLSKLYTPVVSDVLDRLGFRNQVMSATEAFQRYGIL